MSRRVRAIRAPKIDAAALHAHLRATGASDGLDDLAQAASYGRYDLDRLLAALRGTKADRVVRSLVPNVARDLGMLLADQGREDDGALMLEALIRVLGVRSVGKEGRFVSVELKLDAGDATGLEYLLESRLIRRDDPAQGDLVTANALNPFFDDARDQEPWLAALNAMFAVDDAEAIAIREGDDAPFDRIHAESPTVDGPLVTVIMPTFEPDARIRTALESLIAQSHRNLQILVMDDASSPDAAARLDSWRSRDARIEVVHLPENNGPYLARNIAVSEHARGAYVTVHDDDDWSHPRKIERQVAHLEQNPDVVANMVNGVRASDDLVFGRVNGNPVWTQQALSSLMVRREVFDTIGYWDVVNRAGDSEFNDRIRSWTDARIPIVGRVPLMLYRMRWGSLSDREFRRGYMAPVRRAYFTAYRAWHQISRERGEVPYIPFDDRGARPFEAPADLVGPRSQNPS